MRHIALSKGGEADQSPFLRRLERNIRKAVKGDSDPKTGSDSDSDSEAFDSASSSLSPDSVDSSQNSSTNSDSDDDSYTGDSLQKTKAARNHGPILLWVPHALHKADRDEILDFSIKDELDDDLDEEDTLDEGDIVKFRRAEKRLWESSRESNAVKWGEWGEEKEENTGKKRRIISSKVVEDTDDESKSSNEVAETKNQKIKKKEGAAKKYKNKEDALRERARKKSKLRNLVKKNKSKEG